MHIMKIAIIFATSILLCIEASYGMKDNIQKGELTMQATQQIKDRLYSAATEGRLEEVQNILVLHDQNIEAQTDLILSALSSSGYSGQFKIVEYIFKTHGQEEDDKKIQAFMAATIQGAAQSGQLELIKSLFKLTKSLFKIYDRDPSSIEHFICFTLHTAVYAGQVEIIKYFLENMLETYILDPDYRRKIMYHIFRAAVYRKYFEIIDYILETYGQNAKSFVY